MQTREWVKQELVNRGMSPEQADAVLVSVKADKSAQGVNWSSTIETYPDIMRPVLMMTVASHAVGWIDSNLPKAWYRPVFAQMALLD